MRCFRPGETWTDNGGSEWLVTADPDWGVLMIGPDGQMWFPHDVMAFYGPLEISLAPAEATA